MKVLLNVLAISITSLYFFPVGLTFLPPTLNTKMLIAVVGLFIFAYNALQRRSISISGSLLGAIAISVVFSLISLFAADYNHTTDYAYANYVISFSVWLSGAYTVCFLIRCVQGEVNFKWLTIYLALVCFSQCLLALMIDRNPLLQSFVDRYVIQGQDFMEEVRRLYGVGASLDTAGVRFSLVLLMIAALVVSDESIRSSTWSLIWLLTAFFTIAVVGNMISRTTLIGVLAALAYITLSSGILSLVIKHSLFRFHLVFITLLIIGIGFSIYLYQHDDFFLSQMRFAFEGFFNWAERGVWTTSSTEKLNKLMWIWPSDTKTWLIGSGLFDNFIYSTDIGYCRFILYCGLIGFSIFSLFFLYNAAVFARRSARYMLMFVFFGIITFTVWIKVATDIFVIYALFYCLDYIDHPNEKTLGFQKGQLLNL